MGMEAVPQVIEPLYYVCKVEPISNTSTYTVYEIPSKYADRLRRLDKDIEAAKKQLSREFPGSLKGMFKKEQYERRKKELFEPIFDNRHDILEAVRKRATKEIAKKSSDQLRYFDANADVLSRGDVKTLPELREKRVTELLTKKPINITKLF